MSAPRPLPPRLRGATGRAALLGGLLALGACGPDTTRALGLTRDPPDEFQVTTRAPLQLPPRLGELPAPTPGAQRPQEQRAAASVLAPSPGGAPGAPSPAEQALIARAGGPVDDGIRRRVDEESLRLDRPDRTVVDRMMFWRDPPPAGIAVDPQREAQRLRENAALGRDGTDGQTPIIQPRRPGLFEGLFGN